MDAQEFRRSIGHRFINNFEEVTSHSSFTKRVSLPRYNSWLEGIMKILAMEIEADNVQPEQYALHLKAEASRVWELYQSDVIRELYFRADRSQAVLILECENINEAQETLSSLPLVQAGLIRFSVIPLIPYPGFARLFERSVSANLNVTLP
jgi:hypothetical protein